MPEPETTPSGFTRSLRWLTMFNLLVGTVAAIAVLVMVNYLANGHFKRFYWNNLASFKLSPLTMRLMNGLTNDVTATIFFNQANQGDVYDMSCAMLTEYQNANPRHFHVVKIDEERDFREAKELLDRLHLSASHRRNFVAFESVGNGPKTFSEQELANLDYSDFMAHRNARRDAFNGEMYFSGYIFDVIYPNPKKAYFLTGHGERDPGDPTGQKPSPGKDGMTTLAAILQVEANCDWGLLSLQGTNTIPADCQLLIIASPEKLMDIYSPREIALIQDYLLNHNGRLLALLDVDMGLKQLLTNSGIGVFVDTNSVVEEMNPKFRISKSSFEALIHDVQNPIVAPFIADGLTLHMVSPHPVFPVYTNAAATARPDSPQIDYLVGTSPDATDGARKGTFALVAAVQHGVINDRNGMRVVVAGDADFLDDQLIDDPPGANHFFAAQALNWLLQRPDLVLDGLPARAIKEYKITMTQAQMFQAHWLFLAAMPGSVLFLGFLVWLRRRS